MKIARQLPLHLPVQANYARTDFIQSACNQEALQLIESWPAWTGKMGALYGPQGCGKTHLAHIWQEKSGARFVGQADVERLAPSQVMESASAFIIDDAGSLLATSQDFEKWLFHFFNLARETGAGLLFCCSEPPARWQVKLADLQSRLSTLVTVAVDTPDEGTLRTILYKLCSERGMALSPEIADYILRRIERSFDSARVFINDLDHYTLSTHRQLTLGLVRERLNLAP